MGDLMPTASEVRPFRVEVPEEDLVDLRQRVAATRWSDAETVTDQSQGVEAAAVAPTCDGSSEPS